MSRDPINQLSHVQLDVLKEIGNIGAGNAVTSMSKLINKKMDMQVPSVSIVSFNEVVEIIGSPDEPIVAIFISIKGEAPGSVYFILSIDEANRLVEEVTAGDESNLFSGKQPNEFALSAIQETGNILAGSYLSALSDFTHINMQPSIPYLSIDMAGAILTEGLLEISNESDYAIIIDTQIKDFENVSGIHGQFFLLPQPGAFGKIFQALGMDEYADDYE